MPSPFDLRGKLSSLIDARLAGPGPASPAPAAPPPAAGAPAPGPGEAPSIHRHDTTAGADVGSGMFNELSGLGGSRDKGAAARPNTWRRYLTEAELVAEMRSGPYRRLCEILPRWATWKGVALTDENDDDAPLQQPMKRLSVMARFAEADTWARGLGEALIWVVTDDPAPLSEPLDPEKVTAVHNLIVLDAREFTAAEYETDPESPQYRKPRTYHVHPRGYGMGHHSEPIHHTRLLRFVGHELPHGTRGALGTIECDAIGQVLWDALRNLSQISAAGAVAAQELSVSVFKIDGLAWRMSGAGRSGVVEALTLIDRMKGIINGVLLGPTDSFDRVPFNPSGYKDLLEGARLHLALVTSIPLALLFGEAPAGLSTDEKSWWANWTATVSQHQQLRYQEPLEWLLRCIYAAEGGEPAEWSLTWNPIGELSERELAEIRKLHTDADSIALADGTLHEDQVRRSRYSAHGFSFTIQPATPEEEAELAERASTPPPAPPSLVANLPQATPDELETVRSGSAGPSGADLEPASMTADRADGLSRQISAAQRRLRVKVPGTVKVQARRVQGWLKAHASEMRSLGAADRDRLAQLAKGGTLTVQELIAINGWHAQNRHRLHTTPDDKAKPWADPAYVRGLCWGGEVLARLAIRQVTLYAHRADHDDVADDSVVLAIEVPGSVGYRSVQAHVRSLLTDLALETWPHITVLYLGRLPARKMAAVQRITQEVIAGFVDGARRGGVSLEAGRLGHFGSAQGSQIPVVMSYYGWGLQRLHTALLRALAHLINAPQHPQLRLHATLGYLHRPLTPDESTVLLQTDLGEDFPAVKDWKPATIQLRRGGEVVASYPLMSARLDGEVEG